MCAGGGIVSASSISLCISRHLLWLSGLKAPTNLLTSYLYLLSYCALRFLWRCFSLCWSFVADFVEVLVVTVFGLSENLIMTVSLVSCTPHWAF